MTTKQKTWVDLLGPWSPKFWVEGTEIVRRGGTGIASRVIAWSFETAASARACYAQWRKETAEKNERETPAGFPYGV